MPRLFNWEIMRHPINWVTVTLMVLIGAIALHFILSWQTNPTSTTKPAT